MFFKNYFFIILLFFSKIFTANAQDIAVIVPMQHSAMDEIVAGIKTSLSTDQVEIYNAHGDLNLQHTIINKLAKQNYDLVMPIGKNACQMSQSKIKDKKILCVATDLCYQDPKSTSCINDEISAESILDNLSFLKKIAVIYSASEKILPEIGNIKKYSKERNIDIHYIMVNAMMEIPSVIKNIPEDREAILILKDHLIVSAINLLIKEVNSRKIPLIASDEGSVIAGATIAIGVKEKDIGIVSGEVAKEILTEQKNKSVKMDSLTLFINEKSFLKQNILTEEILNKIDLPVIKVN